MATQNARDRIVEFCRHYLAKHRQDMELLESGKRQILDEHGKDITANEIAELSRAASQLQTTLMELGVTDA
jgi:uncharacterized protein YnzC (UPF0291/DUF896 family)